MTDEREWEIRKRWAQPGDDEDEYEDMSLILSLLDKERERGTRLADALRSVVDENDRAAGEAWGLLMYPGTAAKARAALELETNDD
jgi:hypothetical protein